MAAVLVRRMPEDGAEALRERARAARRSMQGEAAIILEAAAATEREPRRRPKHGPVVITDSTLLLREDRDTDHGRQEFRYTMGEFAAIAAAIRARLVSRAFGDSAAITREDRDTDHGHDL